MKNKLFIIGSAGIPARYGGFETFAENISKNLINSNDITVFCDKSFYQNNEQFKTWNDINRCFMPLPANGFFSPFYDLISLLLSIKVADVILILGTGIGVFLPLFSCVKKIKFIVHLDGVEWQRPKWNFIAKRYLRLAARLCVSFADYIMIDNSALMPFIPLKHQNKILQVKYGGDHLPVIAKDKSVHDRQFALVIARAESENNLLLIVRAFEKLKNIDLIIVSDWCKTKYGRRLFKTFDNRMNIIFRGSIFNNPELLQRYRKQCQFYIHGHSAGGTNPSLVEAMYSGCPILAYDTVYNRETTQNHAFYFKNSNELLKQIKSLQYDDLSVSVRKMQDYAKEFYTWKIVIKTLNTIL